MGGNRLRRSKLAASEKQQRTLLPSDDDRARLPSLTSGPIGTVNLSALRAILRHSTLFPVAGHHLFTERRELSLSPPLSNGAKQPPMQRRIQQKDAEFRKQLKNVKYRCARASRGRPRENSAEISHFDETNRTTSKGPATEAPRSAVRPHQDRRRCEVLRSPLRPSRSPGVDDYAPTPTNRPPCQRVSALARLPLSNCDPRDCAPGPRSRGRERQKRRSRAVGEAGVGRFVFATS